MAITKPHFSLTCLGDEWQQRWGSGDAPSGWVVAHTMGRRPTPHPWKGAPPAAKTAHRSNEDIARKRPSRRWKTSFTAVLNVPKEKSNLFSNRVQVWVKSICEQQQQLQASQASLSAAAPPQNTRPPVHLIFQCHTLNQSICLKTRRVK